MGFDLYGLRARSGHGAYFRNSVRWWRRLWALVALTCPDIFSPADVLAGQTNDGCRISARKAEQIAERLEELLNDGDSKRRNELERATAIAIRKGDETYTETPVLEAVKAIAGKLAGFTVGAPDDYQFSWGNVREFIVFCRDSGGFEIS